MKSSELAHNVYFKIEDSIRRLIRLDNPVAEHLHGIGIRAVDHCDFSRVGFHVDFFIDECVVKSGLGGFVASVGIKDAVWSGPVDGAEAHGARLATRVNVAACQLECIQVTAGVPYRDHFRMGGGVVGGGDAVGATAHDLTVFYDHTAERSALVGG